ncbi:MAG: hypothetical protein HQL62_09540 [Magnetococcales bacterium]|nr:hypothetical protein [Magnetococcales bacterium]
MDEQRCVFRTAGSSTLAGGVLVALSLGGLAGPLTRVSRHSGARRGFMIHMG